jgi:hypothetical protein
MRHSTIEMVPPIISIAVIMLGLTAVPELKYGRSTWG